MVCPENNQSVTDVFDGVVSLDNFVVDRFQSRERLELRRQCEDTNSVSDQRHDLGQEVLKRPVKADVVKAVNQIERAGKVSHLDLVGVVDCDISDPIEIECDFQFRDRATPGVVKAWAVDGVACGCSVRLIGVEIARAPIEIFGKEHQRTPEAAPNSSMRLRGAQVGGAMRLAYPN